MDGSQSNRLLKDLHSNLLAGFRLATGRRISKDDFVYNLDQGLWLLVLVICLEFVSSYLGADKPASFYSYGLNYLGAIYLFDLTLLLLISRLAGADIADVGRLLIVYLATSPPLIASIYLIQLSDQTSGDSWLMAWFFWLLPFAWQSYILIRMLYLLLETRFGKALRLATFYLAISFSSLWFLPYSELWYEDDPDTGENPYAELYKLSVEDLFYDQQGLLDNVIEPLAPQRPGVTDLYLLAFGGYGLEKVFLNEVTYVSDLFDEQFDTRERSLVLVNNQATVAQYPMANRHNLSTALRAIGERMDRDEDVLFLFMTSHGGKDHRFSLNFGPVPLDDLTPIQVRQALDEADVRWRVIVISSCYSGGFIDALKDPQTMVITAAAPDRKSFGCGAESEFTDFGTAYFKHALSQQSNFIQAFDLAATWVAEKEKREKRQASDPRRFVGEAMGDKIAAFTERIRGGSVLSQQSGMTTDCETTSNRQSCHP
ncbi:MAG: C13 family peptidase [Candidatus Thiodiazotropha sp. (ex Semelilucina semeliformis)]|nr:C13 family peptidase [Candidatus Thiodiazotropha sp. (ex Semelilucina semeliformis)]